MCSRPTANPAYSCAPGSMETDDRTETTEPGDRPGPMEPDGKPEPKDGRPEPKDGRREPEGGTREPKGGTREPKGGKPEPDDMPAQGPRA